MGGGIKASCFVLLESFSSFQVRGLHIKQKKRGRKIGEGEEEKEEKEEHEGRRKGRQRDKGRGSEAQRKTREKGEGAHFVQNAEVSQAAGGARARAPSQRRRPAPRRPLRAARRPWELTFLTVLAFVARRADAVPIDAGAVAPAGRVDALVHGHIALGPLPAAVALAGPLRVLSVPAAQDRAGGCKTETEHQVTETGAWGLSL